MKAFMEKLAKITEGPQFHLVAVALIVMLTLLAYSNTFTASFHFDDDPAISENATIKQITADNIVALIRSNRPITNLSLMFNYAISGLNVIGWHVFNISFHIANGVLVYLFLFWTFNLPSLKERYADRAPRMALFGALLFALHPIQTESVTYIITRSELLAAFFFLATFLFFIKGATTGKFKYYVFAFVTSLLAMGSKEWAATLPAMLFLYDYLFIAQGKLKSMRARWKAYVLLLLPWGLIAYIMTFYIGATSAGFSISGQKGITPITYLLTSFNVIWMYIRLLFLPINQNLDYDYPLATTLFAFPTLLSFIGHIAVIGTAFWLYKKKGRLLIPFGVAWFYITLTPTQSFVPILDVIFEHRLYLPSIGFFIAFIAGYEAFFDRVAGKKTERPPNKAGVKLQGKKGRVKKQIAV